MKDKIETLFEYQPNKSDDEEKKNKPWNDVYNYISYPEPTTSGNSYGGRPQREYNQNDYQTMSLKKNIHNKFNTSVFQKGNSYTSFSGADAIVTVVFKNGAPVTVGECQTLTYSLYRPMNPVYRLGSAKPSGFTKGPRTIAGSIIFTVFDRHVLISTLHKAYAAYDTDCLNQDFLPDELPPFDFHINWLNEYGQSSEIIINDVHFTTEGQVHSIEDMITENTVQYLATDMKVMQPNINENT